MRTPTRSASRRPAGRLQILPWVIAVSALAWSMSMRLEMASYNHELVARQVAIVEGRDSTLGGHPSAGRHCEPCPRCVQGSMATQLKTADATPDPRAVTFVLVATMNANNGPRVAALLASVQKYIEKDKSAVHTLLAVVPDAELRWWELAASALGDQPAFKVGVLAESAVLHSGVEALKRAAPKTSRRETRGTGYRVQMLLKLGVAEHVPTDFYVTFDCDVVLARPMHLGDLVRTDENGALKAVTQGRMGGPHASRWLSSSLDAFFGTTAGSAQRKGGVDGSHDCRVGNLMHTLGVTPAVMSKHGAVATLERLERRAAEEGKRGWAEYLFSALEDGLDWTEYGLYAAGTCLDGSFSRYYVVDPSVRLYDAALQEDGSKFMDPKVMNEAFGPNPFVVLQSIGGSDATSAADALYSHLGNPAVEATR